MRSRSRSEDGQALVELALAIPFLLFVIFVIIDFGLAINTKDTADNLANVGVRQAAVAGASPATCSSSTNWGSTIQAYIRCTAQNNQEAVPCNITVTDSGGSWAVGDSVTIAVSEHFNWLGLLTNGVNSTLKVGSLSSSSTITQTATMRLEQTASSTSTYLGTSDSAQNGHSTTC